MEMEMERNDESVAAFGRGGNPSSMDAGVGVAKKKAWEEEEEERPEWW